MAPSRDEFRSSLQRRLLTWLLPPLLVVVATGAAIQYVLTSRPALASLDHALGDVVIVLGQMLRADDGQVAFHITAETDSALRTDQFDQVFYSVQDAQGSRIGGDASLAELPIVSTADDFVKVDRTIDGKPVRVVARLIPCGTPGPVLCDVRVAETLVKRRQIQHDALMAAAVSLILVAVGTAACVVVALTLALRPLRQLAAQIARRTLDDLREIRLLDAPREVAPLLVSINRLFGRLREASLAQQAFLANAAHQLRTPLTALRTEAELALLEPHPASMDPTLRRIQAAADRSSRLAHQLLVLARIDGTAQAAVPFEDVDLADVAAACAEEWAPRAIERGVDLGFDLQPTRVSGRGFLLQELLSNLIDNALNYAGEGARVTARTGSSAGFAWLEVEDDGPGVPAAERGALMERFARGAGAGGQGTGLGLAIVRDIAVMHGGRVELLDGAGEVGLRVRVTIPVPAGTSPQAVATSDSTSRM